MNRFILVGLGSALNPVLTDRENMDAKNWPGWAEKVKIFPSSEEDQAFAYWEKLGEDYMDDRVWEVLIPEDEETEPETLPTPPRKNRRR